MGAVVTAAGGGDSGSGAGKSLGATSEGTGAAVDTLGAGVDAAVGAGVGGAWLGVCAGRSLGASTEGNWAAVAPTGGTRAAGAATDGAGVLLAGELAGIAAVGAGVAVAGDWGVDCGLLPAFSSQPSYVLHVTERKPLFVWIAASPVGYDCCSCTWQAENLVGVSDLYLECAPCWCGYATLCNKPTLAPAVVTQKPAGTALHTVVFPPPQQSLVFRQGSRVAVHGGEGAACPCA